MGRPPLEATTLPSKLMSRSPLMDPLFAPMPCAVWQVEQVNPALMWLACWFQLVFCMIWLDKSWHLPQRA